jgi:hypothetical protein
MKKQDEIKFLESLIKDFPMTIYLEEAIEDHIREIK